MKALLERAKGGGLVILAACCLAFFTTADDADDTGGAQVQSTSGTCKAACTSEYDQCTSLGGTFAECLSTYNSCTASCDDDDD